MEELQSQIKQLIIDTLNLEDMTIADLEASEPLFNDGLGLDSIDALELGLAIKKEFNIEIKADDNEAHKHFETVETLAKFIKKNREQN